MTFTHSRTLLGFLASGAGVQALACQNPTDRAKSDEVFREFTYEFVTSQNQHFAELDPKARFNFTGEHAWDATMPRHVPKATVRLMESAL